MNNYLDQLKDVLKVGEEVSYYSERGMRQSKIAGMPFETNNEILIHLKTESQPVQIKYISKKLKPCPRCVSNVKHEITKDVIYLKCTYCSLTFGERDRTSDSILTLDILQIAKEWNDCLTTDLFNFTTDLLHSYCNHCTAKVCYAQCVENKYRLESMLNEIKQSPWKVR